MLSSRILETGGGVTPVDQRYTYDKNANPTAVTDYGNSAQNRSMTYDALDRLAGMNAASLGGQYNYSYDVLDNLRTLAHVGGSTSTFNYDSKNRLASIVNTASGTRSYTWDVQGNLVNSAGKVYQFSYGNRLVAISATAGYRYDGWGRRLDAYDTALQASLRSIYTRGGQLAFQQDYRNSAVPFHTFQYLGGQLAVVVDYDVNQIPTARYPHTDAQGTIVAYTNPSRAILSRSVYDSWGGTQGHGNDDAPGYTGHFQDALTGLTYMQQRYYDPALARFISVDPVGVDEGTGGNFNRYWYAKDNPYRYTDPDGRLFHGSASGCTIGNSFACSHGFAADGQSRKKHATHSQMAQIPPMDNGSGIFGVVGKAIATDVAYIQGLLTGNQALMNEAANGFSKDVGTKAALASIFALGTMGRGGAVEGGVGGIKPILGTRVRPAGVPENWRISPTDTPGGVKYSDPSNPHNQVRVMQGGPNSPYPNSRGPYVRQLRNGQWLDAQGNPVSRTDPSGHIPLDQYPGYQQ